MAERISGSERSDSRVWKFELDLISEPKVEMPAGAQILHVETQGNRPHIWARVDPMARKVLRTFTLVGTGHPVSGELMHLGTFTLDGGAFVGHLFESPLASLEG